MTKLSNPRTTRKKRLNQILRILRQPAYSILLTEDAKDRIWQLHKHIKPCQRNIQIAYDKGKTKQKPPPKTEAMNLGTQATG